MTYKKKLKGMTTENYGKKWEVDHIIPKSWFAFKTPEEQQFKLCWSLRNLQPLWSTENMRKKDRYTIGKKYLGKTIFINHFKNSMNLSALNTKEENFLVIVINLLTK